MTTVMSTPRSRISKAEFKARALEIMRQVQESGQPVVVTDRGHPVVQVAPYYGERDALRASFAGSVLRYDDPTEPVGADDWEALR